jgi:LmbE family N-acetylglucosaminyl deacetylase
MSAQANGKPLSIVVVTAHPHDFTHVAGTCGKHVDRGDTVTVVSLTGGANIHNEPLEAELRKPPAERNMDVVNESSDVYAGRKKHELHAVCALFGISDVRVLPYADNPLNVTRALEIELGDIIYELRPHMVITHAPYAHITRGHPDLSNDDHKDTGKAVQRALGIAGTPNAETQKTPHSVALIYYMGIDFGWQDWELIIDVESHAENRLKAEMLFQTQGHTEGFARHRIEMSLALGGWVGGFAFGESFIRARPQIIEHLPLTDIELTQAEQSSTDRLNNVGKSLADILPK